MVHGHPFDHTMWEYQYDALQDYRLLLPDLKGYGQSNTHLEKVFIESQALDLALLLDELGIKGRRVVVVVVATDLLLRGPRVAKAAATGVDDADNKSHSGKSIKHR